MKFNLINSLFALLLGALLAYICYVLCDYRSLRTVLVVGSFVEFFVLGMGALGGLSTEFGRTNVVISLWSWLLLVCAIIMDLIFACVDFNIHWFVISNALFLLLFLLIAVGIARQKQ
jgi:hypothetical protein